MQTAKIPPRLGSSEVVREAYELLTAKHAGQRQKVNGRPYVEHPVAVAADVAAAGFDADLVAAALLHDIVEDSDLSVADVRDIFGERIAALVDAMTDPGEIEPYERRKAVHRERVLAAGPDAMAIFAADKLNNVRALRAAYAEEGEEVVRRFTQPLDVKLRVWEADAKTVSARAPDLPYAPLLAHEVEALLADRASRRREA